MTQMSGLSDIHHLNYTVWLTRSMKELEINQQETSWLRSFQNGKFFFFLNREKVANSKSCARWKSRTVFSETEHVALIMKVNIGENSSYGNISSWAQNCMSRICWSGGDKKQICFWSEFQEVVEKWNSCQFGQMLQNAC